ncbi:hypothetical protein P4B35_19125 [Pontiellaceae bacterium B12227]|nr:hypothetical protein [Pontiellaceae bacterium B12227]
MNIQVPWKMRMGSGSPSPVSNSHWWVRKTFQADLDVAKRPSLMVEDDLDHLGSLHKQHH